MWATNVGPGRRSGRSRRLAGPLVAGRPRPAEPQAGVALDQAGSDGALADATRSGDHDDQRRSVLSHRPQREQSRPLLISEAAQPPAVGDADLVHHAAGLDLADAREGLDDRQGLGLADDVVAIGQVEHLAQLDRTHLQALLELGADTPGVGGLFERILALGLGENGGCCHGCDRTERRLPGGGGSPFPHPG
jgi:hypothetical protein